MFNRYIVAGVANGANKVLSVLRTNDSRLDPLISLVRWRRPPWAPLRASKLFRVRVKPEADPEEVLFRKKTNDEYKAAMRSLRYYIQEELEEKAKAQTSKQHIDFEEDFKTCLHANTLFNKKSAELRASREIEEKKLKEEQELNLMMELEQKKQEQLRTARHEVLETIDKSSQFINKDNLSRAIEEALNTRQLYNFAIDLEGKRYVEREDGSTEVVEPDAPSGDSGNKSSADGNKSSVES